MSQLPHNRPLAINFRGILHLPFCLTKQQSLRYNRTATADTASNEPRSSSGPGHRPFKAEITGSNPVRGTYFSKEDTDD
jgi:hypothetical protein